MNTAIPDRLAAIIDRPGLRAGALVDADTGLVWHECGAGDRATVWEAAVDYWRLWQRQKSNFPSLGPLGSAVMYHHLGVLAVLPCCKEPALLVVVEADHRGVDWIECQRLTRELGSAITNQAPSGS